VAYLSDTNLLLRGIQPAHPMHPVSVAAMAKLLSRGERVCIAPQNIMEFWNVCTRPVISNGLGLSLAETERQVAKLEALLILLPDAPAVHAEWRRLVIRHGVSGVKVYDVRLVAAMRVYEVNSILTFNVDDFKRYPGIRAVLPKEITDAST
jgi:predicted nucleic acid-binding protein